jgi:tetratricopeptide (TPR) repeat protein
MKALRVTLVALFIFALLQVGCHRKQAGTENTSVPSSDEAAQQQQQGAQPLGDAHALFDRGMDAYRHNRDEEAVEDFKRAVEADPDFAEGFYRLGLAYNVTRQTDEADKAFEQGVKAFEKLTKQDPKNSDAYYFLGLCYEKLGKYDEAVKALKEAVKNSPTESDDKYFELAQAHYKLAQYDESVRALNKTLEINPDYFPAQELLEQARSGLARIEEFRKHQEQLRKQQAGNSNSNNSGNGTNTNSAGGSNSNTTPPT